MANITVTLGEVGLAAKYTAVALVGFAVDATVLHMALLAGLQPAWARVISLAVAMNVTFVINGRHVFQCLDRSRWAGQWLGYMTANGFGNVCNYWIFLTLVSTHWRIVSTPIFAVAVGSASAWAINSAATRWLVFGAVSRVRERMKRR